MSTQNPASVQQYVLEILWTREKLPRIVGPFDSEQEAIDWATLSVSEGSIWVAVPLAYPYLRAGES